MKNILRSWNEEEKRFYYFCNGKYYSDENFKHCISERTCKEFDWCNAERFTYMTDYSGKNIFEGDVLLYETTDPKAKDKKIHCVVFFCVGTATTGFKIKSGRWHKSLCNNVIYNSKSRVVSNISESIQG